MTIDLQPRLLMWARERAGLTAETLAEKLGVSAEKVAAWEQDGRITYRQAEKLASVTHTAFGYLFLAEPPDERLPIPDLRTVGSVAAGRPSPDLLDVIYQSQRRQEWFREYQIAEDGVELEFVGSTPVGSSVKAAAAAIRKRLNFHPSESKETSIYKNQPNKIGRRFASALIASTLEGKTLFRDAMSLLDMKKTATFQELVSRR